MYIHTVYDSVLTKEFIGLREETVSCSGSGDQYDSMNLMPDRKREKRLCEGCEGLATMLVALWIQYVM